MISLAKRKTARIEQIRNSGLTDSGIYVFDHDDTRDIGKRPITMLVRVLDQLGCDEVRAGKVYMVLNPYAFAEVEHDGVKHLIMSENNFISEIEGYDDEALRLEDELDAEGYPVCGKC